MSTLYIFLDWVDVDCGNLEVFQTLDYWWLSIPPSHLDLRITGLPESVQACMLRASPFFCSTCVDACVDASVVYIYANLFPFGKK